MNSNPCFQYEIKFAETVVSCESAWGAQDYFDTQMIENESRSLQNDTGAKLIEEVAVGYCIWGSDFSESGQNVLNPVSFRLRKTTGAACLEVSKVVLSRARRSPRSFKIGRAESRRKKSPVFRALMCVSTDRSLSSDFAVPTVCDICQKI